MSRRVVSVNGTSVLKKFALVLGTVPLVSLLVARQASADVASWAYLGGGVGQLSLPNASTTTTSTHAAIAADAGFGIAPTSPLVVGFVFKSLTYVDQGTDLGLALRTTTSGFSRGDWGGALDLGVMQRFWGETTTLPNATLSFGLPWGLTVGASVASNFKETQALALTVGIDWARLTVHRTSGVAWWGNYRLPVESLR